MDILFLHYYSGTYSARFLGERQNTRTQVYIAIRLSLATRVRQPVHLLNLTHYVMLKDNAEFI